MERDSVKFGKKMSDFNDVVEDWKKCDKEQTHITVFEDTEVVVAQGCDVEYLKEHNIRYTQPVAFSAGGSIVCVKGNMILNVTRKLDGGRCLTDTFSEALRDYLISRGLDSTRCDNNDVLVDGYKVASGCETRLPNGTDYFGYQISVNQDVELIKRVCTKPMVKIPIGLGEYGITTQEIVDFCVKYWTEH